MGQQSIAGVAALVVLAFVLMALSACASSDQSAHAPGPVDIASVELPPGTPEFHAALIGQDALRSRIESE